jgi:lysophospholipase L1-like esterase
VLGALAFAAACDGAAGGGGSGFPRPQAPRPDALDAAAAPAADAAPDDGADPLAPGGPALVAPPGSLDAWHAALARAEAGAVDGRVLVSMFGDSHTAGDHLTARLRAELQRRFGDAGRGIVAAGKPPYRHYYQRDVEYGSSGAWKAFVGGHKSDPEPYGLMGFRVEATRSAEAWVETCAACPTGTAVSRFELFYLAQPGGADLEYRVDDEKWKRVTTASARGADAHPESLVVLVPDGPHKLALRRAKKGIVSIFGVAMERDRPGVVLDGLGVVGRRMGHLHQWDWSVIGAQLAKRDPRLVIVQYGTNEADDDDLDLERVAMQYDEVLARLRAVVPNASVLVLGPPDMAARAAGKACDKPPPKRRRGDPPPVLGPDGLPVVPPECQWHTPEALTNIIAVQRAAAARAGVAFFDTFAAMGGGEQMDGWSKADPKVAYGDRVHFTDVGYTRWADALLAELLAGYDAYVAARAPAARAPAAAPSAGE